MTAIAAIKLRVDNSFLVIRVQCYNESVRYNESVQMYKKYINKQISVNLFNIIAIIKQITR